MRPGIAISRTLLALSVAASLGFAGFCPCKPLHGSSTLSISQHVCESGATDNNCCSNAECRCQVASSHQPNQSTVPNRTEILAAQAALPPIAAFGDVVDSPSSLFAAHQLFAAFGANLIAQGTRLNI
jgi:hypothetical protein